MLEMHKPILEIETARKLNKACKKIGMYQQVSRRIILCTAESTAP